MSRSKSSLPSGAGIVIPLIPKKKSKRGRPRNDDRQTLNGILYVLKTGCAWGMHQLTMDRTAPAGDD
ncbi:transposase [Roseiflexus castenholzii]|uniref:transposase n=1 Tax=Roseiflexus castenholzii TaxID=120962 RepID=UPI003C7C1901